MAVSENRPGSKSPGGKGRGRRPGEGKTPPRKPNAKPTTPPEPGFEWVQQANGNWVQQEVRNPNGTTGPGEYQGNPPPDDPAYDPSKKPDDNSLPPGYRWGAWDSQQQRWGFTQWPEDPRLTNGSGTGTGTGSPGTDGTASSQLPPGVTAQRVNATEYLRGLFKQFGFSDADTASLMNDVQTWISTGLADAGTEPVLMKFRDTDIYKRRFAGMAELTKRGQAITEADYIQLESSYRNVMQNYGLPDTYYDNPDDYARLIGAGLSVNEVEQRVVAAKQAMNPLVAQELKQYYSVGDGDLTAYMLGLTDEKGLQLASARNQEDIRKGIRAAQIGAAGERAGFNMDQARAEGLGGTSVGQTMDPFDMRTLPTLESTFDQARREANRQSTLASIENATYTDQEALNAAFGDDKARLASEQRAKRERARFSGSSGVGGSSLSVSRNL